MKHSIVSCLESRVEEDGKIYGKFFIGPCNFGQGTTLGTALRRTLLSETNGIAIVAVEIRNADHEYSSLVGVRESVLDIILNLKELALVGDVKPEKPCIGFLNVSGPAEVKASHIRFPLGIRPIKSDHHIATVTYDGNLSLKVFVMKGRNYMNHNPSTIRKVELLDIVSPLFLTEESSLHFSRKVRDLVRIKKAFKSNSFFGPSQLNVSQNVFNVENELDVFSTSAKETKDLTTPFYVDDRLQSNFAESTRGETKDKKDIFANKFRLSRDEKMTTPEFLQPSPLQETDKTNVVNTNVVNTNEELVALPFYQLKPLNKVWKKNPKYISFSQKEENLQLKFFWNDHFKEDFFLLQKDEKSKYLDTFLEILEKNLNSKRNKKLSFVPSFQKKILKSWAVSKNNSETSRRSIPTSFYKLFKNKEKILYISPKRKQEGMNKKKRSILPVDGLFSPIQRVNFRVETDMSSMLQPKDSLILEIWTNGALHPRQALFESAEKLIQSLCNFSQSNPMIYGLKFSPPLIEEIENNSSAIDFNFWKPEMGLTSTLTTTPVAAYKNVIDGKPLLRNPSSLGIENANSPKVQQIKKMEETQLERTNGESKRKGFAGTGIGDASATDAMYAKVPEVEELSPQNVPLVRGKGKNEKMQGINYHQNQNQKVASQDFPKNILSTEKILKNLKTIGTVDAFDSKTRQSNFTDQRNKESTISPLLYKLDIANLNLPLALFVKLKNFQIHTVQDLSTQLSKGSLASLKEEELKHFKKALEELGINTSFLFFSSLFKNKN